MTPTAAKGKFPAWLPLLVVVLVLCCIPALFALIHGGGKYLGFEYNTDDQMVYSAWIRQGMDGQFFFDNRFTTDAQPRLTIHVYFLVLGWVAKVVGIPLAAGLSRVFFSGLFVVLLLRLVKRLQFDLSIERLAPVLVVFGGGIGFVLWQMFDISITKPVPDVIKSFLIDRLPIDVWQPEALVFPSMLTNSLFMVSLCLILLAYESFLNARDSWRWCGIGFGGLGVLMNIHSYDVLGIALVVAGFLVALIARRQVNGSWVLRAAIIGSGAIAPALWFVHVLQNDPVFQSRAATETYSPNFRAVLLGFLPLILLGVAGAYFRARLDTEAKVRNRRLAGVGILSLLVLFLTLAAQPSGGYMLGAPVWGLVFAVAVAVGALWADENPAWSLVFCWAAIGTVAIYFPGLFQRKLTMGLSIPWALLAAYGLQGAFAKAAESSRRLYAACALLVMAASSALWLIRDISFIGQNVSNTTRHPVYLDADLVKIVDLLGQRTGRTVVLALPGAGAPAVDDHGDKIPDSFSTPPLPDIAPILSGLAGVYTYAGHWSETPDYGHRAADMSRFFLSGPVKGFSQVMTPADRSSFIQESGATMAVLPSDSKGLPLVSAQSLGKVVYQGPIWTLVELSRG